MSEMTASKCSVLSIASAACAEVAAATLAPNEPRRFLNASQALRLVIDDENGEAIESRRVGGAF